MASEKITVVLKTADDWDEWVEIIKSAAIGLEVWDLINPNKTTTQLRRLERPERPRPSDIKEGATGITKLSEDEKDEYKFLKKEYERELTKYETYRTGLGKIRTKIQESVSRSNLQYTFRKDTPYDMLVALKDRYAPSDTNFKRERDTHKREQADLSFSSFEGQSDSPSSTAAGNKESRDDGNRDNDTPKRRKCFCNQEHLWRDCPYVNDTKRSSGWKPEKEIQEKLERMLESNTRLRSVVESVQKRKQEDKDKKEDRPKEEKIRESLYTRGESYFSADNSLLKDSFLLDSASDSHVCNNSDRFTNMRPAPADATLRSGGGRVKILGYGTVIIRPEPVSPGGDVELTLSDVAYAPNYPANLVSYDIAISKQIFWDAEKGVLIKKGKDLCRVNRIHKQWVLEYNPISSFVGQPSEDTSGKESTQTTQELLTKATPREIPHYTPERNTSGSQDSEDSDSETDTDLPENPTPLGLEVEDEEEMDESFVTTDPTELQQQLPTPGDTPERTLIDAPESIEEQVPQAGESAVAVYQPKYEISSEVDPRNIIEGGSRTGSKRREAYVSELSQQPCELMGIRSAYTTAMEPAKSKIHRDQLPKEPNNWWQMLKHPYTSQWLDAVKLKYDTLLALNTFRQVPIPKDDQVVPITWKFVYEFDTDVYLVKFKARLYIRGDLQKLTLKDTYAATLAAKAFRALTAIPATIGQMAMHWDVVLNGFCQAELDKVINKSSEAYLFCLITWVPEPTSQRPTNGLTKPLTSQNHDKFARMLNLQRIKGLISENG